MRLPLLVVYTYAYITVYSFQITNTNELNLTFPVQKLANFYFRYSDIVARFSFDRTHIIDSEYLHEHTFSFLQVIPFVAVNK